MKIVCYEKNKNAEKDLILQEKNDDHQNAHFTHFGQCVWVSFKVT